MAWSAPGYKWKLWYEDGRSFSSLDGEPWESPEWGVALVVQTNHPQQIVAHSLEYYYHRTDLDMWCDADPIGMIDQMVTYGHLIDCVRVGRWVRPQSKWSALVDKATLELRGPPA